MGEGKGVVVVADVGSVTEDVGLGIVVAVVEAGVGEVVGEGRLSLLVALSLLVPLMRMLMSDTFGGSCFLAA